MGKCKEMARERDIRIKNKYPCTSLGPSRKGGLLNLYTFGCLLVVLVVLVVLVEIGDQNSVTRCRSKFIRIIARMWSIGFYFSFKFRGNCTDECAFFNVKWHFFLHLPLCWLPSSWHFDLYTYMYEKGLFTSSSRLANLRKEPSRSWHPLTSTHQIMRFWRENP